MHSSQLPDATYISSSGTREYDQTLRPSTFDVEPGTHIGRHNGLGNGSQQPYDMVSRRPPDYQPYADFGVEPGAPWRTSVQHTSMGHSVPFTTPRLSTSPERKPGTGGVPMGTRLSPTEPRHHDDYSISHQRLPQLERSFYMSHEQRNSLGYRAPVQAVPAMQLPEERFPWRSEPHFASAATVSEPPFNGSRHPYHGDSIPTTTTQSSRASFADYHLDRGQPSSYAAPPSRSTYQWHAAASIQQIHGTSPYSVPGPQASSPPAAYRHNGMPPQAYSAPEPFRDMLARVPVDRGMLTQQKHVGSDPYGHGMVLRVGHPVSPGRGLSGAQSVTGSGSRASDEQSRSLGYRVGPGLVKNRNDPAYLEERRRKNEAHQRYRMRKEAASLKLAQTMAELLAENKRLLSIRDDLLHKLLDIRRGKPKSPAPGRATKQGSLPHHQHHNTPGEPTGGARVSDTQSPVVVDHARCAATPSSSAAEGISTPSLIPPNINK